MRGKGLALAWEQYEEATKPSQPLDFHIPSDIVALQQADPTLRPGLTRSQRLRVRDRARQTV